MIDEAERSLHDALCVIRSLIKNRSLITGGGSAEVEISHRLSLHMNTLKGLEAIIFRAYAEALEIIPFTLAENAGMNPINVVTELRNRHNKGEKYTGISVKKGTIVDMKEENVLQPSLVTRSALTLATEVVRMILKIDDVVMTARWSYMWVNSLLITIKINGRPGLILFPCFLSSGPHLRTVVSIFLTPSEDSRLRASLPFLSLLIF